MYRAFESSLLALARHNQFNRSSVFDVLAASGITSLTIEADLSRHAGLVVRIDPMAGDCPALLPAAMVRCLPPESAMGHVTLPQAIDGMLRDFLDLIPGELENDFATFELDVAERRLTLTAAIAATCLSR